MQRRRQLIFERRQHEAGIGDSDRQRSGSRVDLHLAGEELALALLLNEQASRPYVENRRVIRFRATSCANGVRQKQDRQTGAGFC